MCGEGLRGHAVSVGMLERVGINCESMDAEEEGVAEVTGNEGVEEALATRRPVGHFEAATSACAGLFFFHVFGIK